MAVRIRLKRMGKVRTPFYRIVVCDSRTKRDGRVIEEIGTYNPKTDPSTIHLDSERALHWLGHGAQPSTPVAAILKLTGDWQKFKGEPGESTLRTVEPRRDKTEIFNEALKDAHGDAKSEAVTKKAAKSEKPATPEKKAATPDKKAATPEKKPDAADESVERADKAHAEAASGEALDSASGSEAASDQTVEPTSDQPGEAGSDQVKSDEA